MDCTVKIIKEVTPILKDCIFILVLCLLIIQVVETDTFGINPVLNPADSILTHFFICNSFLDRQALLSFPLLG